MKKFETTKILCFIIGAFLFSSCATIVGGSRYIAHVTVQDHPNATIMYNNAIKGKGEASFKIKRKDEFGNILIFHRNVLKNKFDF